MERVAVFGGSFNPPHDGHLHIAAAARNALQADRILWLVTPQNPHKTGAPPAPYRERFIACKRLTHHLPYITVSDIERRIASRCTHDTLTYLTEKEGKHRRYVWIAGSDVIPSFHLWKEYQACLQLMPFAFFTRGDNSLQSDAVVNCPIFRTHARYIHRTHPEMLMKRKAPALQCIDIAPNFSSSTHIRKEIS